MPKKTQPAGFGMKPCKTELGSFIRTRRLKLGLRQIPLTQKVGVMQQLITLLETGKRKYLDDARLEKLAQALKCDPEELRKRMPKKHVAEPKTDLGMLIRSRREELGLTLEQFAKKARITRQQAKILELRQQPGLAYESVKPLAKALDIKPSVLAGFVQPNRKPTNSALGGLVRARRKELAMSGIQLAGKLGISCQFVYQIESGRCTLSKNDGMIKRLAKVLKLDAHELQAVRPKRRLKRTTAAPATLGRFLADKRLELHLTLREVAERAEMSTATISSLEWNKIRPTRNVLDRLALALNCQVPPEFIPPPGGERSVRKRETALGKFLATRRQELELSQAQVASRAGTSASIISGIECGTYPPGSERLKRISKALECEIPADLVPTPKEPRAKRQGFHLIATRLPDLSDLEKIKELSGGGSNSEVVRKALRFLHWLLEKQRDGYTVFLRKGEEIAKLELFL